MMTVLPILMLALGMNTAAVTSTSTPAAASLIRRAEISLNRSVPTVGPRLRELAVEQALSDSRQTFSQALAQQLALTRVRPRFTLADIRKQAKAALDHGVKIAWKKLGARAVSNALRECRRDVSQMLAMEIAMLRPASDIAFESVVSVAETTPVPLH